MERVIKILEKQKRLIENQMDFDEEDLKTITEIDQALQLHKTQVSGSVCLETELQILLGYLIQQKESSFCYLEKKKITNKINAVSVLLGIDTAW